MMPLPTTSYVARYFNKIYPCCSKCEVCGTEIKTSGNTTNLISPMKRKHPNIKMQVQSRPKPTTTSTSTTLRPRQSQTTRPVTQIRDVRKRFIIFLSILSSGCIWYYLILLYLQYQTKRGMFFSDFVAIYIQRTKTSR